MSASRLPITSKATSRRRSAPELKQCAFAANCRSAQLRVERNGCGNGRVYTITIRIQDLAGNRTTTSVKVLVPPNASTNTAVDDGPLFTVASSCP